MDTVTRTSGAAYGFQYRADGLRSAQVYKGAGTSQSRITTMDPLSIEDGTPLSEAAFALRRKFDGSSGQPFLLSARFLFLSIDLKMIGELIESEEESGTVNPEQRDLRASLFEDVKWVIGRYSAGDLLEDDSKKLETVELEISSTLERLLSKNEDLNR